MIQQDDKGGRLEALRAALAARRLDGFVVPRADEFQGEFVPAGSERLAWLTGFTGSAGAAVVLADCAALFVDGRYTLQARVQVDTACYELRHLTDEPIDDWLAEHLAKGARLGFDPWLHTANQAARLHRACARAEAELVAVENNPIDTLWDDRPPPPMAPVVVHPVDFAGEDAAAKRQRIAAILEVDRHDATFLGAPESVAWLLNVRGGDVPYTPMALAFAVLGADGTVELFLDPAKLPDATRRHLGNGVRVRRPDELGPLFDELGRSGRRVRVDRDGAPAWVWQRLERAGATVVEGPDPCILPKARKNPVELDGFRGAHRRDGAAMVRFLAWLEATAPGGRVSERDAIDRLEGFRAASDRYRGPSFETIAGAGPNGAIVHYRCTPQTNRVLEPGNLFLIDSGGHYVDGTTDVTRTVAIGQVGGEMRQRFTQVLRGHIALACAVFPAGTSGSQLDAVARAPLWRAGLDYDHGTGHGVGSYLSVHEGPARISKAPNRVALDPGMVLSNEPGYYLPGHYGIRIENLVAVETRDGVGADDRQFLGFETLTLVPLDRTVIDSALLNAEEIGWVDAYHVRVREALAPQVDGADRDWLLAATRPLVAGH